MGLEIWQHYRKTLLFQLNAVLHTKPDMLFAYLIYVSLAPDSSPGLPDKYLIYMSVPLAWNRPMLRVAKCRCNPTRQLKLNYHCNTIAFLYAQAAIRLITGRVIRTLPNTCLIHFCSTFCFENYMLHQRVNENTKWQRQLRIHKRLRQSPAVAS